MMSAVRRADSTSKIKAITARGGVVLPLVTLLVVFSAGILVGESDLLQRYVFPKKYWSAQVRSLQEKLVNYKRMANDDALKLKQAEMKAKLAIAQELYDQRYSPEVIETNRAAIDRTEDEIEAVYIKDVKETFLSLQEMISQTEEELAEAKKGLADHP